MSLVNIRPPRAVPPAALALAFAALLAAAPARRAATQTAAPAQAAPLLLVLNKAENTLAIVDPEGLRVVGRVPVGEGPHEVVTSPDGRLAYVTNYGAQQPGNSISVVDLAARREVKRIELGALLRPHGIAERDGKLYFTAEVNRAVARLDPSTGAIDWLAGTGQNVTHMLALHPRQKTLYTANILSDSVTVLELDRPSQPGPPPRVTQIQVGRQPEGIDVSPDGREVWVGSNADGSIAVIDTETQKVRETFKVGGVPIRVKFTPDGRRALVSNPPGGELIVIDAATRRELKRLPVGDAAVGVLIAPDGRRAYVAASGAGRVVAVNLDDLSLAGSVETGKAPDGLGWAGK